MMAVAGVLLIVLQRRIQTADKTDTAKEAVASQADADEDDYDYDYGNTSNADEEKSE